MSGFTTAQTQVRILLRDISGKFVWDTSVLYTPAQVRVPPPSWEGVTSGGSYAPYQAPNVLSPPRHTKRHRHPEELPTFEVGLFSSFFLVKKQFYNLLCLSDRNVMEEM